MKTYSTQLLADVVSSYDKTKTSISGLVAQKTINTKDVLGPPLSKFIDIYTDTLGTFSPGLMFASPNGRLFVLIATPASGAANQIVMYNFNLTTGSYSYVGRIGFNIATPAATMRAFKVDDSNPSNIKIFFGVASTTPLTGGLMMINKVAVSDFVVAGFPIFYTALANDVKGVYHLTSTVEVGLANSMTAITGITVPFSSVDASINTKAFAHNGVSATHQLHAFDYSVAPNINTLGTSTVTANNTTGVSTTFTMAGNTLAIGDPVVITSNAPTGYTNTTNSSVQTIYYVVAANFVAGNTFSLSATSGGAILAATTAVGTTTFARALGSCTNLFHGRTPNLPALLGTLLVTNPEDYATPQHTANAGQDCYYWATSTTQYLGRYSDLFIPLTGTLNATINVTGLSSTANLNVGMYVSGPGIPLNTTIASIVSPTAITLSLAATTSGVTALVFGNNALPSLVNSNFAGTGLDYMAITPVNATYSSYMDCTLFSVVGIFCLAKRFVNSFILGSFGVPSQIYLEAQNHFTDQFSMSTISALETRGGWVFATSTSVGQRGILCAHIGSDSLFDLSNVITPVQSRPRNTLVALETLEELFDVTGSTVICYRGAATASDPIFNSASGGWIELSEAQDYSSIVWPDFFQFKINFSLIVPPLETSPSITTPSQVSDLLYVLQDKAEISDYWDYSYNDSDTGIPTRVGFTLRNVYPVAIPKLFFRAYDTDGNLVAQANTVDNVANFQKWDGAAWVSYAAVPNVIGTRIRFTFTTPPGVDVRVALQES